jgi:hypothetical protein
MSRGGSRSKKALEGIRAKLAKQTFDWEKTPAEIFHFERFEDHGVSFSDRATVLVGVANLELALQSAIQTHFVELTPDENLALFSAEKGAPLSTLGSKIRIGYALGVYEKMFLDDLKIIQLVRNYFAHSSEHIDFSDPDVISAIETMNSRVYGRDMTIIMAAFSIGSSAKNFFMEAVKWAAIELILGTPNAVGPRRIKDRSYFPRFDWPPPTPETSAD